MNDDIMVVGFWKRLWAHWLDSMLVGVVVLIPSFTYIYSTDSSGIFRLLPNIFILCYLTFELYQVVSLYRSNTTLGRKAMGFTFVRMDGGAISLVDVFKKRSIFILISTMYVLQFVYCINYTGDSCSIRFPLSEIKVKFDGSNPFTLFYSIASILFLVNALIVIKKKSSLQDYFSKLKGVALHQ
ncbi:MAG: RDD family protein [Fibrobacterales bacterium]